MRESLEGYVIDIACLRKYPRSEWAERGRTHSRSCALMGHCMESGYALVSAEGQAELLDTAATPMIVDTIRTASQDSGIYMRALREADGEEMATREVALATPTPRESS